MGQSIKHLTISYDDHDKELEGKLVLMCQHLPSLVVSSQGVGGVYLKKNAVHFTIDPKKSGKETIFGWTPSPEVEEVKPLIEELLTNTPVEGDKPNV